MIAYTSEENPSNDHEEGSHTDCMKGQRMCDPHYRQNSRDETNSPKNGEYLRRVLGDRGSAIAYEVIESLQGVFRRCGAGYRESRALSRVGAYFGNNGYNCAEQVKDDGPSEKSVNKTHADRFGILYVED